MSNENEAFLQPLMSEEASKRKRLSEMASSFGLPIYESFRFAIPNETDRCLALCDRKIKEEWKLSVRLSIPSPEKLVFRQLDIDVNGIIQAIEEHKQLGALAVRVDPYKIPVLSGTLLVSKGDAHLEMVFGPHKWLTKSAPSENLVYRCTYRYLSVKHSTLDLRIRKTLFRCMQDVVRITLGVNIRQLAETQQSVYAEFHWHDYLGYRFLECSFSPIWTRT